MPNNDLISRSALLEKIGTNSYRSIDPHDQRGKIFKMVATFPSVDAEPVRHGRWIINKHYGDYECSECGKGDFTVLDFKKHNMKYCPNCGCKMDAEVEV